MSTRPEPREAPPGYHYTVVVDAGWRTSPVYGECRWSVGPGHRYCHRPAEAMLNRGRVGKPSWWAYCGEHLYGRWIEGGQVVGWRLERDPDSGPRA